MVQAVRISPQLPEHYRGTKKLRRRLEEKTGSKGPFLQTAPQLF